MPEAMAKVMLSALLILLVSYHYQSIHVSGLENLSQFCKVLEANMKKIYCYISFLWNSMQPNTYVLSYLSILTW